MTPGLLFPAGLLALAALALPLVIHLSRRTDSRTVDFAALKWLLAKTRPRRRPRLDELLLLASRLLLLTLLAIWFAEPVLWGAEDRRPVVAAAPGIDPDEFARTKDLDARRIWLAPGFPPVDGPVPAPGRELMSLVRQLDAELAPGVPLTLVLPPRLEGVDPERPRLTRPVTFRLAGSTQAKTMAAPPAAEPSLTVRYAPGATEGVRYFRAAAAAWAGPDVEPAFEAGPADDEVGSAIETLVWLAPGQAPPAVVDWVRDGGLVLLSVDARVPGLGPTTIVWSDPLGEPLAVAGRLGRGRAVQLTRPLTIAANPALADADFPDALSEMLRPRPAPATVRTLDHIPLSGARPYPRAPADLSAVLALLIAVVFFSERWLATRGRRGTLA